MSLGQNLLVLIKKKRVYQTMKHYKPVENLQKNIPRKAEMYFIQSAWFYEDSVAKYTASKMLISGILEICYWIHWPLLWLALTNLGIRANAGTEGSLLS